MKALCWHGKYDVRVDTVPDPTIVDPADAIVKITSIAIYGSDLHADGGRHEQRFDLENGADPRAALS